MSAVKRVLRRPAVESLLATCAALYIRLVHATTRWTIDCPSESRAILEAGQPFIACFWHGRMVMMRAALPADRQVHVLISGHRDGQLISKAIRRLQVATVAGSSRRGGAEALRQIERLLRRGDVVAITPDGPRGPRMRAKPGAIKAAQLSGVPILPLTGGVSRRRLLGSWDRFCLAWPVSRGVVLWGTPIIVPRSAEDAVLEQLRGELETQLNRLTREADSRYGQPAVEPDPTTETPAHAGA